MSAAGDFAMSEVWHDVECGSYEADLPVWEALAAEHGAPVLDLGCGTGRLALHLARRGHPTVSLDLDPALVATLNTRAGRLPAEARVGDARDFDLGREFPLVVAPMQLLQLFEGEAERVACLTCVARHLDRGGRAALAIAEDVQGAAGPGDDEAPTLPPVPDAREMDGWVYSSLPLETVLDGERIVVRRLRQTVSPDGELSEAVDEVGLYTLSASTLEREAAAAGLRGAGRLAVGPTEDHVGSTVVLLKRRA
jgi:SAM-dependent methyltransferase